MVAEPGEETVRALGPASVADLDKRMERDPQARLELIDGVLYELPMNSFKHGHISTLIVGTLFSTYQLGRGGPGGWWIHAENGFSAKGREVFRPDAVGWHRERVLGINWERRVEVVPDWICEVLSPNTRKYDLGLKAKAYARIGVRHGWYIDPKLREFSVYELRDGEWSVLCTHRERDVVRVPPFEETAFELESMWADSSLR